MKKMYLIGALMLMGVGVAFLSCDNKDSIANGCKCTATEAGIESSAIEYTKDDVKATGVNTCSGFAAKLVVAAEQAAKAKGITLDNYTVSCYAR